MLRIAIAQIDPVVGAFESNVQKIKEAYLQACASGARLVLTPELGICGYPLHDLLDRPEMFERNEKALDDLARLTRGQTCALAVGHIAPNVRSEGRRSQNVATVLENGKTVFRQAKKLLPTYDVFDEARYFEPAETIQLWNCDGMRVAVAICEDLWGQYAPIGRRLYSFGQDPVTEYQNQNADLIIALSASPYERTKKEIREGFHQKIASRLKVPLVYVNQVGATDEILFDGGSFALNSEGQLLGRLPFFKTSFGIVDLFSAGVSESVSEGASKGVTKGIKNEFKIPHPHHPDEGDLLEIEVMTRGLVTGIRDYFARTGFKQAILGLSGGIDSAVVAVLAAQALGPRNVLGVAMPSQFSSSHSLEDAEALAKNLGIRFEVQPIKFLNSITAKECSEKRGNQLAPVALENLQSRLRGLILMTLSNHDQALVLTTGNKSELAMGYCTLYGDMVGALAPIGDLFKTKVYQLARHINESRGSPIPERTLTKAPSAEFRPGQTDQDSLPPYPVLDEILEEYLEKGTSVSQIEEQMGAKGFDKLPIPELLRRLELNEYKRRQGAPVLKVSRRAFGIGRRIPIAKIWEQN